MGIKTVKTVHLYPKELSLYGDSGNVLCAVRRLEKRGYKVQVIPVGVGESIPDFDLMFIGGGQDRETEIIARDIRKKSDMLKYAVHCGKTVLAICGGYQLLGEYFKTADGRIIRLSGALPFYTEGGKSRMTGNIVYETAYGKVAGFENHGGRTFIQDLPPLGRVITGYGNNGIDKTEGILFKNTFCTYAHGPVLPKNPRLADEILSRAVCERLAPLDDSLEIMTHNQLIKRFN